MPKRLISCLFLSLCMCFVFALSANVKADASSVQITDNGAGTITVVVSEPSFNGKEMSIVCYDPSWNGAYTDWESSKSHIVYIGQKKINGVTTISFKINNSWGGDYTLVLGAGGQKIEKKFSLKKLTGLPNVDTPHSVKAVQTAASKVKVSWKSVINAVKYTVYRSTKKNSGYKKISDVTACSYTDKKCKAGKTYYYKVTATNGKSLETPKSDAAKVKLMAAPKIKVALKGKTAVVSWKKIKGVKGYKVYTSDKKKGKYKQAVNIKKAKKVKCSIKLGNKKSCYIKVRAYKKNGKKTVYGKYSAVKKAGK